jgi:hypothetical protein
MEATEGLFVINCGKCGKSAESAPPTSSKFLPRYTQTTL